MKPEEKVLRAAYWTLSRNDANEVIEDGCLLLDVPPGPPRRAVVLRALREPGQYRAWVLTFGLLALCLLALSAGPFLPRRSVGGAVCLYLLGQGLSLFYFRRAEKDRLYRDPGRQILAAALVEGLLLLAVVGGVAALYLGFSRQLPALLASPWNTPALGGRLALLLQAASALAGLLGLWGLYRAKVSDERWLVLYDLGLLTGLAAQGLMATLQATTAGGRWALWGPLTGLLLLGIFLLGVWSHQKTD